MGNTEEVERAIIHNMKDSGLIFYKHPHYSGWIAQRTNDGPSVHLRAFWNSCKWKYTPKPWSIQLSSSNSRTTTFVAKSPDDFKPGSIIASISRMLDCEERCAVVLRSKISRVEVEAQVVERLEVHAGRARVHCSQGVILIEVTVSQENESRAIEILKAIGGVP